MENLPGNVALTNPRAERQVWRKSKAMALAITLLTASSVIAAPHTDPLSSTQLDAEISATLDAMVRGDINEARVLSRSMAARFPNFALGQLLYAELEATAAFDNLRVADELPMTQTLIDLLNEARVRLEQREIDAIRLSARIFDVSTEEILPSNILQIGTHITDLVVVDLADSMLYQYESVAGVPSLVRQHYVGSGSAGFGKLLEGDEKTPLGLYRINGFRDDASLPDLYGAGALMLDYPNALDRHLGRTGSGIWLHGVPRKQHSRAPYSSEGCVTMSNDHFVTLKDRIVASTTHVLLTHSINWQRGPDSELNDFRQRFNDYQSAWLTGDTAALEGIYAPSALPGFVREAINTTQLGEQDAKPMRVANNVNTHQHIEQYRDLHTLDATKLSIVKIPVIQAGDTPHLVMEGRFGSNNENHITLYWAQQTSGQWHIVSEKLVTTGT